LFAPLSHAIPPSRELKAKWAFNATYSAPTSAVEMKATSAELFDAAMNPSSTPQSATTSISTIQSRRSSLGGKMKEELRAVSGWFLNVSTTSSKAPEEIILEVTRVLNQNAVSYRIEKTFTMICQIDVDTLLNEMYHATNADADEEHRAKKGFLAFQIEVCKVPKMNLHGLNFKRLTGGVWNYKKVCNKLLQQMNI